MNNNYLIESNILNIDEILHKNLVDTENIPNSENAELKESEEVALHALLELSLDAALGELKEEQVNMNMNSISGKINGLKKFIRSKTIGHVNSAPNSNFAPPTPTNRREGTRPRMNNMNSMNNVPRTKRPRQYYP